jgi:hypothetical protein
MECDPYDADCEPKFDTLYSLKYCSQFKGNDLKPGKKPTPELERRLKDAEVGDHLTETRNCRYVDNLRLTWEPGVESELFIPTRFKQVKQFLNPDCYDPEAKTEAVGSDKYDCTKAYKTEVIQDYYVADIGEFHVALEHTFNCPALGEYGSSASLQGFFAACKTNAPLTSLQIKTKCQRMAVPQSTGDTAPEDMQGLTNASAAGVPSLRASFGKDTITLSDLLKLTPVAQRFGIDEVLDSKLPDKMGHPQESLREKGGILMLDVNYDNTAEMRPGFGPFPVKPITYTYRPSFVPAAENYKYQLIQTKDNSDHRIVDIWYGISIRMTFNGEIVKFQLVKLFSALTTGLVLLASASTLVLYLAAYVLPLAEKYCLLLYQLSEDFSDYCCLKSRAGNLEGDKAPKSMYWVGALLFEKLQKKDGTATPQSDRKIKDDELLGILATTEMRLNRLDGMDPLAVFDQGNEMDQRLYTIGDMSKTFYSKEGIQAAEMKTMSYRLQAGDREPIPPGKSSRKLGNLKKTS